jgi:5'-deoxynucleotidase
MKPDDALSFLREVNTLGSVERTGFAMRGVQPAESVAAHSLGVLAAALVTAEIMGEPVDRGKLALMALLHDLGEARVGDTPMTVKNARDEALEEEAMVDILERLPGAFRAAREELEEGKSLEARLVWAGDKLQMLAKVLEYEAAGEADLAEFWVNPGNFRDAGLEGVHALHDEILRVRDAGSQA